MSRKQLAHEHSEQHCSPQPNTAPESAKEEWINKMAYSHAVEYYSVVKRNRVLKRAIILDQSSKHDAKSKQTDTDHTIQFIR